MRDDDEKKQQPNVKFERPLDIRVMTIDGTRSSEGRLFEISDCEARVELAGHAAELSEFFLILTSFGNPVFRRCRREWVDGALTAVSLKRTNIGIKSSKKVQEHSEL